MKKNKRRAAVAVAVVAVATAATLAATVYRADDHTEPAAAAPVFKSAELTEGSLDATERVDGSIEISTTYPVLHRIEGGDQTSTVTNASVTTSGQTGATTLAVENAVLLRESIVAVPDDSTTTTTEPTTTTTEPTADTTEPTADTTEPGATSTTAPQTTPVSSDPLTTVPAQASDPTSSTTTTDSGRGVGGFGGPSGGFGGATTPAGNGGATTGGASSEPVTQTVTSIIGVGASVSSGDILYTVDSQSVVMLEGALPAWRTMSVDSSDGADIAQLELALVALGYDPDGDVVADDEFDSATETMVERWQAGRGDEVTGEVTLGSVVFIAASTTVASVNVSVGQQVGDGDVILELAGDTQQVVIDVPAEMQSLVSPGLAVQIGDVAGTVSRLRSADRDGTVVVQAVITPSEPIDDASNGSTVTVTIAVDELDGVLLAPVDALLSRLDGTYSVQVQNGDSLDSTTARWVTVDVLGVSGNRAAISGDGLAAGTTVLVPA